jgi:hypothetical protein
MQDELVTDFKGKNHVKHRLAGKTSGFMRKGCVLQRVLDNCLEKEA